MPANQTDPSAIEPSKLATRMFGTSRKGFDQDEVRVFLRQLAKLITTLQDDNAALQADKEELTRQVAEAEAREVVVPDLDEDQLTAALGAETARVLATARRSAGEIRSKAEDDAAKVVREAGEAAAATTAAADASALAARTGADTYAAETRAAADAAASTTREQAEAHAAQVRTEADEAAAAMRSEAQQAADTARSEAEATATSLVETAQATAAAALAEAEAAAGEVRTEAESLLALRSTEADAEAARIRSDADAVLAAAGVEAEARLLAAKEEGRQLVVEAQQVREQMLRDLARRRKAARQQLEQLRAGRERLLDAFDVVRRSTDEATGELLVAMPEARVAAQEAARRTEAEDEPTVAELEAEIATAKGTGLLAEPVSAEPTSEDVLDLEDEFGPEAAAPSEPPVVVAPPVDETIEVDVLVLDAEPVTEAAGGGGQSDAGPLDAAPSATEPVDGGPVDAARSAVEAADATVAERPASQAPAAEPELHDTPSPDGGQGDESPAEVDELFARLRAAREHPAPDDSPGSAPADAAATDRSEGPSVATSIGLVSRLEERDGVTDEIEQRLARRLKRLLADEQNAVLDAVRRARKVPSAAEVLPPAAEHAASYADAATDELAAALAAGAAFQGTPIDVSPGTAADLAQALAVELTGLVRPRIERCFDEVGGDEEELTALIRSGYREWKTQQIAELARHHVLLAFSQGQFEAMPDGATIQWVIDDSGAPCPDAEDNALAGLVVKGDPFPTGHCFPPAHPGCRCLVVIAPH